MACRLSHKLCRRLVRSPKWCPTRLLDIGFENGPSWKLQIASIDIRAPPPYMTLSYTWGFTPSLKLTRTNINELRRGSLVKDLPQTFQDMIIVARRFSIRYIWIDALCIIQDDKQDWEIEASLMQDVYVNSACNVAAAASVNPHGGLFRSRHASDIQQGLIWSNAFGSEGQFYRIIDEGYWDRQLSDTILHQRGWALQERLLASRTLHFTKHQIFWECFLHQKCEAYPNRLPEFVNVKAPKPVFKEQGASLERSWCKSFNIQLWKNIVKIYTKCALTMPNDKLVALSGLAKLYHEATGDEYIAGLWKSHILECLNWYVVTPIRRGSYEYRAPSWSWAATDGAVSFDNLCLPHLVLVLDMKIARSTLDPTGQVYSGFIDLEAVVIPATYSKTGSYHHQCCLIIGNQPLNSCNVFRDNFGEYFEDNSKVHCVALGCSQVYYGLDSSAPLHIHLQGMFLKLVPDTLGTYFRIGYFEITNEDEIRRFGVCVDSKTKDVKQDEAASLSKIRIV